MKRKTKIYIFDCLMMAALAFLFALMYELFVAPNHFAPSGVNGIATMIEYVTDGAFSVGYFSLIVNIPLCVAAFFLIDRGFAVKTFIFSLLYSVFLLVLRAADLSQFQYDAQGVDTIYPVLIAGAISGFVYGLAVRRNSSTGGADVIAKYVSKKNPLLNFFLDQLRHQRRHRGGILLRIRQAGRRRRLGVRLQAGGAVHAVLPDVELCGQFHHPRLQIGI